MKSTTHIAAHWLRRFKRMHRESAHAFGLSRSSFRTAKGSRILAYHGVCREDPLRYNTLFIRQRTFESQLRLFKKYFTIVSLDQFYRHEFDDDRFAICLTFDDGFANNYTQVLPLLEKYKVPATFFITGARVHGYDILWNDVLSMAARHGPPALQLGNETFRKGRDGKYLSASTKQYLGDILRSLGFAAKAEMIALLGNCRHSAEEEYWRLLEEDQVRSLAASEWAEIGSHSSLHNDLAQMDPIALKQDLAGSKRYLERITGREIRSLAFPYGSYSPVTVKVAQAVGFTRLLATEFRSPADKDIASLKERLTINPFISPLNQIYASITGNYK